MGLLGGVNGLALLLILSAGKAIEPYVNLKPIATTLAQRLRPNDQIVLYRVLQQSLEFYTHHLPVVIDEQSKWGELRFGIQLEPDPTRFLDSHDGSQSLLASPRTVYCIADEGGFPQLQRRLRTPIYIVMKNAKRVVFCNHERTPHENYTQVSP